MTRDCGPRERGRRRRFDSAPPTGGFRLLDLGVRALRLRLAPSVKSPRPRQPQEPGAWSASLGGPGEILVSRTVADLVAGTSIRFVDRGTHELKGLHGAWQLYEVAC